MGDQGKSVLLDAVSNAIRDLDAPHVGPTPVCESHHKLVGGVRVLLLCKQAEMTNGNGNSITVGNVTVSGSLAVLVVAVTYLIAKVHGFA